MRLTRDGKLERTDIWREGKWVDLWSVVHLLSGVSVAFAIARLGFGFPASAVIAFLLFVAYELWEAMVKIHETPQNRSMDVVAGMVSFVPVFFLVQGLSGSFLILAFGLVLTGNIVLATFGWLASRKAEEFEQKLRSEFMAQRERLRERRARIRTAMKRRSARIRDEQL
ncbi:MAG: hypothetical protein Q7R90_03660 [bacterium]|nr:hypothetical protein [bacterium]